MPIVKEMTPLIDSQKIDQRVRELGEEISKEFEGEEITLIGVLKGSFIFLADLARAISCPVNIEFVGVSSYEGVNSTGQVRITHDLQSDVTGKNLIIVEDIIDTGLTMDYLLELFAVRNPARLRMCTLLSKPKSHTMTHRLDYVGFEIDKDFVIGYGLDLDGRYRNLPDIMKVIELEE